MTDRRLRCLLPVLAVNLWNTAARKVRSEISSCYDHSVNHYACDAMRFFTRGKKISRTTFQTIIDINITDDEINV